MKLRLGLVEQRQRIVEITQPSDDKREAHPESSGELRNSGVLGESDPRSQLDLSDIETTQLLLGETDRPL